MKQRKASQPVDTRKDQVEKLKMASGVAPGVNPSPSLERRSPGPGKPGMKMAKSMESIFPGQEERLTSLTFDEVSAYSSTVTSCSVYVQYVVCMI